MRVGPKPIYPPLTNNALTPDDCSGSDRLSAPLPALLFHLVFGPSGVGWEAAKPHRQRFHASVEITSQVAFLESPAVIRWHRLDERRQWRDGPGS